MVAYFHTTAQVPSLQAFFDGPLLGSLNLASGVDIFFVISGFVMQVSNDATSRPGRFIMRRVIRVVPLYWFLTLCVLLLALACPSQFRTTTVSGTAVLKSLLFIPYVNPAHPGELFPLLVPGWSLNLEMFFYAAFALGLLAPPKARLPLLGALFGSLICFGLLAKGRAPAELLFYTDMRLLEFWCGTLIADLSVRRSGVIPRPLAVGLIATGLLTLLASAPLPVGETRSLLQSLLISVLPSAAVIQGAIALEQNGWLPECRSLQWLGDLSYSLYLSHIFALGAVRLLWNRLDWGQGGLPSAAAFAICGMLCSVACAAAIYYVVEKPCLQALQRPRSRGFVSSRPTLIKSSVAT